jgi:hypothetical protein
MGHWWNKELKHPAQVSGALELAMKWQTVGSASCHQPYRIAYRLSSDNGVCKALLGNVTVNHWHPGCMDLFTPEFFQELKDLLNGDVIDVSDKIRLPVDLPAGKYRLSVAIVDQASASVVRLRIQGRSDDGWYPLSEVQVVR